MAKKPTTKKTDAPVKKTMTAQTNMKKVKAVKKVDYDNLDLDLETAKLVKKKSGSVLYEVTDNNSGLRIKCADSINQLSDELKEILQIEE